MAIVTATHTRGARVWRACIEAAAGDDDMEAWKREKIEGRRLDTFRTLHLIVGIELDPVTVELLMMLYSAESYLFFNEDSGWTDEQYQQHILEASLAIIRILYPEL